MRTVQLTLLWVCACAEPPQRAHIRMLGRNDGDVFRWSASGFEARFSGTRIALVLRDRPKQPNPKGLTWPNRFRISVDDRSEDVLIRGEHRFAAELPAGEHRLTVQKQTEAFVGDTALVSLDVDAWLPTPKAPARRIEIIGDSITAGYGIEGTEPCTFSAETQNMHLSYGAITARALQADLLAVAWSGKGVVRNYENPKAPPPPDNLAPIERVTMAQLYAPGPSPDVLVVALGTNDFSAVDPGDAFVDGYARFLSRLRGLHPNAEIVCLAPTPALRGISIAAKRHDAHVVAMPALEEPYGCDHHPSIAHHAQIADVLTKTLRHVMDWP